MSRICQSDFVKSLVNDLHNSNVIRLLVLGYFVKFDSSL